MHGSVLAVCKCGKMQSEDRGVTVRVCVATGYLVICVNCLVEAHQLLSTLVIIACIDMPQHEHISVTDCPCLTVQLKCRLCVDSDWVLDSENCAYDVTVKDMSYACLSAIHLIRQRTWALLSPHAESQLPAHVQCTHATANLPDDHTCKTSRQQEACGLQGRLWCSPIMWDRLAAQSSLESDSITFPPL